MNRLYSVFIFPKELVPESTDVDIIAGNVYVIIFTVQLIILGEL